MKILLYVVLLLTPIIGQTQKCDFDLFGKKKFAKNLGVERSELTMTMPRVLREIGTDISTHFVKVEDQFYWGIDMKKVFQSKFEIGDKDPVIVQFENDEVITLYPRQRTDGKYRADIRMRFRIRPYYNVSPDELKLFAEHKLKNIKIYFTWDGPSDDKSDQDDLGNFFEPKIQNKKSCKKPADCILQFL